MTENYIRDRRSLLLRGEIADIYYSIMRFPLCFLPCPYIPMLMSPDSNFPSPDRSVLPVICSFIRGNFTNYMHSRSTMEKDIWYSVMSQVVSALFFKYLHAVSRVLSIHSFIHSFIQYSPTALRLSFRFFPSLSRFVPNPAISRRPYDIGDGQEAMALMVGNLNISSEKRLLFEVKLTATSYSNIELKGVEMRRRRSYEVPTYLPTSPAPYIHPSSWCRLILMALSEIH